MIGTGVLIESLADDRVESVVSIGRRPSGHNHPKLRELIRSDLLDYNDIREQLRGLDACFYCLGVSSVGMDEAAYTHVTYELTVAAADVLAELNPRLTFCFVSGAGTDSTEEGRVMWARVKGRAENDLLDSPIKAYLFRPGYIQPMKGARSKTALYRVAYLLIAPFYPILKRLAPRQVTTTENVGRAMIEVAANGFEKRILGNAEINDVAGRQMTPR